MGRLNKLMRLATLYKKFSNQTVQCLACAHYCKISGGKVGICSVRKNIKGELYSLVYGLTSGTQIDPIEKKPFFHFFPGQPVFSTGTIGCNMRCLHCQNAWMSQTGKGQDIAHTNQYPLSPKEIIKRCKQENISIIAYTYNEPSIAHEYNLDTAKLAHKEGIKNVYVTNGYMSKEALEEIAPYLDAINIDLKSFSDEFYKKICGARLQPVLDTIKRCHEKGIWLEITTLIIPGRNDGGKELQEIAKFIVSVSKDIPWHVTRFHPTYKLQDSAITPESKLKQAYEVGKKAGLKYIYVGNISNENLENTFCPKCNELLVRRFWNSSEVVRLSKSHCDRCDYIIPGLW